MKNMRTSGRTVSNAFTLIELLIVIAIIAILAAMIFPATAAFKKRATINKVQTELQQISTAIDRYKEKFGFYPPDNPNNCSTADFTISQLYFELSGTLFTNLSSGGFGFRTLDGSAQILTNNILMTFGVSGFVNSTKGGRGDDAPTAKNFLTGGVKSGQYGGVSTTSPEIRLLACSVTWPESSPYQPVSANPGLNPWRYNSSCATNNPGSYDLWVDVMIGKETNRISNWSKQPQRVGAP